MPRGRPPTPIGTHGEITIRELAPGKWQAEARFRRSNGDLVRMSRRGKTKAAAATALKKAMVEAAKTVQAGVVDRDSLFAAVAELYLAELDRHVARDEFSPNSVRIYRSVLKNWINTEIGKRRMRELTVGALDALLNKVDDAGKAKETRANVKKALLGVCGFAVRHGALEVNLAQLVARSRRRTVRPVDDSGLELSPEQFVQLQTFTRTYVDARVRGQRLDAPDRKGHALGARSQSWDVVPDLITGLMSTTARVGEVLALAGGDVTLADDGRLLVHIGHHLVRYPDRGLVRVPGRKNNQPPLTLAVPGWSAATWTRLEYAAVRGEPLFPNRVGRWQDLSNVSKNVRALLTAAGYDWATAKTIRMSVSKVMRNAGVSIEAIAAQLGNTPGVAGRHYVGVQADNVGSMEALEALLSPTVRAVD